MKRKIRAISFDFWNTLFRDDNGAAYSAGRLKYFLETVKPYHDCCEERASAAFQYCIDTANRIWLEEQRTACARERIELVLEHLAMQLPEELIEPLARRCGEMVLDYPPTIIEHLSGLLPALRARYKLAVISDTGFAPGRVLREVLKLNSIYNYFDHLTFSDEAGRSKPHSSLFLNTAYALGVDPAEMIHIGDLEITDVAGAKAVGATAILFAGESCRPEQTAADFVIDSYAELLAIVDNLTQGREIEF